MTPALVAPVAWRYLVPDTANAKIVGSPRRGLAAATYLPIRQMCDRLVTPCPHRLAGTCYAMTGHVGMLNIARETHAGDAEPIAIARALAAEIAAAILLGIDLRPLRLSVSGDLPDEASARAIGEAIARWRGPVWGYSHAWREVPRAAWGRAAVLASCESMTDAREAIARGYVPAITVARFPRAARAWRAGDLRIVPCPQQTRGVPCVACGLCWRARPGTAIAFEAHGARAEKARRMLPIVRGGAPTAAA